MEWVELGLAKRQSCTCIPGVGSFERPFLQYMLELLQTHGTHCFLVAQRSVNLPVVLTSVAV